METKPNIADLKPEDIVLPPKKPRVKKRFTSREQITRKIDQFTKRKSDKEEQIRKLLIESRTFRESSRQVGGHEELLRRARRVDDKVDQVGRSVVRLDRRLSALRNALGEFQTNTIPGITDDRSVEGV